MAAEDEDRNEPEDATDLSEQEPMADDAPDADDASDAPDANADDAPDADADAPDADADAPDADDASDELEDSSEEPEEEDDDASSEPSALAPDDPPRSRRLWMVAIVAVVLLALDLWTKQWAWDNLREGMTRVIIQDWVYFEFGFNTGSAFSLLRDASWSRLLFIGITFLALVYMGYLAKTLPTRFGSAFVAIAMVASGALGNLHDRFLRTMVVDGQERYGVVDFIKVFYWRDKPWPTFNIADVALVAGVLLLLLFLLRHGDVLDAEAKARAQAKAKR